jgi:hypothetical protein
LFSADITSDVRSRLELPEHEETRGVVRIVLDRARQEFQLVARGGGFSRNRAGARLLACPARGFGVGADRHALGARQVLVEPAVALRERLGVRIDALHRAQVAPARHQVLLDAQLDLAADPERRDQQEVQRAADRALGGILRRHHGELRRAGLAAPEHLVDGGSRARLDRAAEMLAHRLLAEGALGPEVGDAQLLLQPAAGGNDLAEHARGGLRGQRIARLLCDAAQDLRFALRTVGRRAALQRADAPREAGPALQALEQLVVQAVDLAPQLVDVLVHGSAGRYLTASTPSMPSSSASAAAGTGLSTSARV